MAKLSAKGRMELARVTKETNFPEDSERGITWERMTLALMSDRTVLEKRDVTFPPLMGMSGYNHTWGWKVKGNLKAESNAERWTAHYLAKGWTLKGGR